MTVNELIVSSNEQLLSLSNGYSARIFFDPFYKRWYYNMYDSDGTLLYAGIALNVDTAPLKNIAPYYLALVDKASDDESYEPYNELGSRLGLLEVTE